MQFTYYLPIWAILIGITITACITVYGYLIVRQSIHKLLRNTLICLRILAITVLLFCLLAPVIIEKKDVTPPSHLSILVDTSRSMELEDNYHGKTDLSRMDQVNQMLFDESSSFLQDLKKTYKVHLYRFDSSMHEVSNDTTKLNADGILTDINSAIREIVQTWRGQPNAGIVLISDGGHNSSKMLLEDTVELDTPIFTIGVGSPLPPKDIQISNVDVSPVTYTGHETVVRITIVQSGYTNESIRVTLQETKNNRLVDAVMLQLTKDSEKQAVTLDGKRILVGTQHIVELKLTPEMEGNFQFQVNIPNLKGELTDANNVSTFSLKVLKAKLNVLYFEGRPRWEYAFLKRTLERDPDIETEFAVLSKKPSPESVLSRNDGYYPQDIPSQLTRFPNTLEELSKYDVLVLGDISEEHLTLGQQQAIIDFVEESGKAVIFLPSQTALGTNGFRRMQLSRLLPIQIPVDGCQVQNVEFAVELTQSGMFHPILQLHDKLERNIELWQNLPALNRSFYGFQLRAGASTLIRKMNGQPILIFQRVGLGKSLLFTTEGLWNWHFGVNTYKDEIYQTVYPSLWAQAIRWMAQQSDESRIYLTTDSPTYAQGDTVQIGIRTISKMNKPQTDVSVHLTATTPSGSTFPLKTNSEITSGQTQNTGHYTAKLKVEEKGVYKIHAIGVARNISLGQDEIDIVVHPQLVELQAPQLNERLMKELSKKTGGVYLTLDDAESISNQINFEQDSIFVDEKRDVWAHPLVLIAVVGLLGVEWFLRKRNGLI